MRTVHFRSLSIAAVAVSDVRRERRRTRETPGTAEHTRGAAARRAGRAGRQRAPRAHFTALAERYAAEAKRHMSMSQSFVGNPSRNLGTGMSAHCKQLADLNTQSATELRELAAYHQKLASGAAATPPAGGARFEGGAGAPAPTEQELNALAAKASTPADHRALEEYFLTLAKRYTAEANEHVAMANTYRGTRIAQAAVHRDRLGQVVARCGEGSHCGCRDAQAACRRRPVAVWRSSGPAFVAGPAEIASSTR